MRLNNLTYFLASTFLKESNASSSGFSFKKPMKNINGGTAERIYYRGDEYAWMLGSTSFGIKLGSNATPVTPEDYTLEFIEGVAITESKVCGVNEGKAFLTITANAINNNADDVNVNELGFQWGLSYNNSGGVPVLLAREVLPETVIIKPGETKSFSLTIEI